LEQLVVDRIDQERVADIRVLNLIDGNSEYAASGATYTKLSPHDASSMYEVPRSGTQDVERAVEAARSRAPAWGAMPAVKRGLALLSIVEELRRREGEMSQMVSRETGKSPREARGEVGAAVQQGLFFAGECQRLFGQTKTSAVENKHTYTVREPVGVAGLIIAANTPIANVAWKVFPALACGNSVVLKSADDAPGTAWLFGEICRSAGLPHGVLNIVHGFGEEAGAPLAAHPDIGVVSFTGSTRAGRSVHAAVSARMAKVSLELGGKNALMVCDDADLDNAVAWAIASAFSNAGQRCSSASRIVVFEQVYDEFKALMVNRTRSLRLGSDDASDLGPVMNSRQLENMLEAVRIAVDNGATLLVGGHRSRSLDHEKGFYMMPTILEEVDPRATISTEELFGPVTCLYRVRGFEDGIERVNDSPYGLTASIHTRNINRAVEFSRAVEVGSVIVNGGTFGSEPHYPFGGLKDSGNGTREPGQEAVDIYTNLKTVSILVNPSNV